MVRSKEICAGSLGSWLVSKRINYWRHRQGGRSTSVTLAMMTMTMAMPDSRCNSYLRGTWRWDSNRGRCRRLRPSEIDVTILRILHGVWVKKTDGVNHWVSLALCIPWHDLSRGLNSGIRYLDWISCNDGKTKIYLLDGRRSSFRFAAAPSGHCPLYLRKCPTLAKLLSTWSVHLVAFLVH